MFDNAREVTGVHNDNLTHNDILKGKSMNRHVLCSITVFNQCTGETKHWTMQTTYAGFSKRTHQKASLPAPLPLSAIRTLK